MFEKEILKRNKELVSFVKRLHREGTIEPDTYVIDLDSVYENALLLKQEADKNDITLFQMTKQLGRNPKIANVIKKAGITHAVAVDWKEAELLYNNGIKIGNIGHIVQVPKTKISKILKMKPTVWTVYSLETIKLINTEAKKLGIVQDIIVRVYNDKTVFYPSQNGGIDIKDLKTIIKASNSLENIKIVGATSFPCLLLDKSKGKILPTDNVIAVTEAVKILKDEGLEVKHINIPSANNVRSIKEIKNLGGNFGEPGHAFTGTTPITSTYKNIEKPAMLYYSQVSHLYKNEVIAFAGGHYRRGKMKGAFIGEKDVFFKFVPLNNESIDYYFSFKDNKLYTPKIGDSVITSFRTQIFVTRSRVMLVEGLSDGKPKVIGIFDSQGRKI